MELTAAPVVTQPMVEVGAPGKTDFVKIYIASELNKHEYRTTLRHEQAHVWAGHNRRRPKDDLRIKLWEIACEMEIARTIYDEKDLATIAAPRSRLAGGYVPDSIEGLPADITLAEDIYDWLRDQPGNQMPLSFECCACSMDQPFSGDDDSATVSAEEARAKLDADEKKAQSQIAAESACSEIRSRPPSLTSAVDSALRVRVEREKSYRRPSRRDLGDDIIMPGRVSTPRPPLVEIFVDRSGSFNHEKTKDAERHLAELLSRYHATIRADVWFFGGGKLTESDPGGGGDTPYHLICQHLKSSLPKLAIVITDNDPVGESVGLVDRGTTVLCVPVGCSRTSLASALGGLDVASR